MDDLLTTVTEMILNQSLQVAALFVLVAFLCFLLRKADAHFRYLLWCIVIIKCLIPPLLTVPVEILPAKLEAEPLVMTGPRAVATVLNERSDICYREVFGRGPAFWLGAAWIAGASLFLLYALIKAIRVHIWLTRERRLFVSIEQRV